MSGMETRCGSKGECDECGDSDGENAGCGNANGFASGDSNTPRDLFRSETHLPVHQVSETASSVSRAVGNPSNMWRLSLRPIVPTNKIEPFLENGQSFCVLYATQMN